MDVYRAPTLSEPAPAPPRALVYEAIDRERDRGAAVALFQLLSMPVLVGVLLAAATTPGVGLAAMIASGAFAIWHRRRSGGPRDGAILRVEQGKLCVLSRDGSRERARCWLGDLTDVSLEIKTIQRVQEGDSMVPAVRFTDTRVGPEIDTARIVLVFGKTRGSLALTERHLAHMDATEWLGKIRVFLRKHGWVPHDERRLLTRSDASAGAHDDE